MIMSSVRYYKYCIHFFGLRTFTFRQNKNQLFAKKLEGFICLNRIKGRFEEVGHFSSKNSVS